MLYALALLCVLSTPFILPLVVHEATRVAQLAHHVVPVEVHLKEHVRSSLFDAWHAAWHAVNHSVFGSKRHAWGPSIEWIPKPTTADGAGGGTRSNGTATPVAPSSLRAAPASAHDLLQVWRDSPPSQHLEPNITTHGVGKPVAPLQPAVPIRAWGKSLGNSVTSDKPIKLRVQQTEPSKGVMLASNTNINNGQTAARSTGRGMREARNAQRAGHVSASNWQGAVRNGYQPAYDSKPPSQEPSPKGRVYNTPKGSAQKQPTVVRTMYGGRANRVVPVDVASNRMRGYVAPRRIPQNMGARMDGARVGAARNDLINMGSKAWALYAVVRQQSLYLSETMEGRLNHEIAPRLMRRIGALFRNGKPQCARGARLRFVFADSTRVGANAEITTHCRRGTSVSSCTTHAMIDDLRGLYVGVRQGANANIGGHFLAARGVAGLRTWGPLNGPLRVSLANGSLLRLELGCIGHGTNTLSVVASVLQIKNLLKTIDQMDGVGGTPTWSDAFRYDAYPRRHIIDEAPNLRQTQ